MFQKKEKEKGKTKIPNFHFQRLNVHSSYRIEFQFHEFICDATRHSVKHGKHTEAHEALYSIR